MRIVAQRVSRASVTIDGVLKSQIGKGMMVLLGIEDADNEEDVEYLCQKHLQHPEAASSPSQSAISKRHRW